MIDIKQFEVWFVAGSRHLYGPAAQEKVAANSQQTERALASLAHIPFNLAYGLRAGFIF